MSAQRVGDLTIGVVGPHDLVERVMLMGHGATGPVASRLVAAAYRDEQEAADKVMRLGSGVDVCLFASPVPYEYARKSGVLTMPATYVPLNGASLHEALLRIALDERYDAKRLSIDILNRADVEEAYSEVGMSAENVHVREEMAAAATLAAFHERLWRRETTSAALTCVRAVADRLESAGVPTIRVRPTGAAIRSALQTAALLGAHHRLEEAQLAVVIVDVPTLRESTRRTAPRYWREELKLALHRLLVQEAHRMHAAAWAIDDHTFLVAATRGSIASATEGFRIPPFVERVRAELGIAVEVGIGMGRTTQDAETHARAALTSEQTDRRTPWFAIGLTGHAITASTHAPKPATGRARAPQTTLARLVEKLAETDAPLVVDAESAGRMLGVTPRTARRLLAKLAEEGLAWPLPPDRRRTSQPGRPREVYKLNPDKLHQSKTAPAARSTAAAAAGREPHEPGPSLPAPVRRKQ